MTTLSSQMFGDAKLPVTLPDGRSTAFAYSTEMLPPLPETAASMTAEAVISIPSEGFRARNRNIVHILARCGRDVNY